MMTAPRGMRIFVLLFLTSTGCAGLQDAEYTAANWGRAEWHWLKCTTVSERWSISSDYAKGWKDGFKAASSGRGCNLPAVPPPCYWSYKYQGCDGQAAIADWYRGWQCGAAAAQSQGYPSFHEIPTGPQAPFVAGADCRACAVPDKCSIDGPCGQQMNGPVEYVEPYYSSYSNSEVIGLIGPNGTSPSANEVRTASSNELSPEQQFR